MNFSKMIKNVFGSSQNKNTNEDNKSSEPVVKSEIINSPLNGHVKKLSEVSDPMFAEEIMGKGIAIEPSDACVIAPVNGVVSTIFNTKHAIGIQSDSGAEILIHIGIDTVNLDGKYFKSYVKQGDKVNIGDLLVEFDIEKIKNEGYDVITFIIITNTAKYKDIKGTDEKKVNGKDSLMKLTV